MPLPRKYVRNLWHSLFHVSETDVLQLIAPWPPKTPSIEELPEPCSKRKRKRPDKFSNNLDSAPSDSSNSSSASIHNTNNSSEGFSGSSSGSGNGRGRGRGRPKGRGRPGGSATTIAEVSSSATASTTSRMGSSGRGRKQGSRSGQPLLGVCLLFISIITVIFE